MTCKRNSEAPLPEEIPVISPQPHVKPPVEPTMPPVQVEAPRVQPEEISPYDFPPPGEVLFPEIFE